MCPSWCGPRGCWKPLPLFDGLLFQRPSRPAPCRTRRTLAGLTATPLTSTSLSQCACHIEGDIDPGMGLTWPRLEPAPKATGSTAIHSLSRFPLELWDREPPIGAAIQGATSGTEPNPRRKARCCA